MKLNKIALALVAVAAAPMAANAGVTVSPLLLGYHYTGQAQDAQRELFLTGKPLKEVQHTATGGTATNPAGKNNPYNGGIAQTSGLYTGAALGIELTPSTQFQVEYGVSNTDGQASEKSAEKPENRFDVEQETISGNFLIGVDQFTGYSTSAFRPYVLVGAGQSKIKVENQQTYIADYKTQTGKKGIIEAGTEVAESTDTIGNLGLGAMYRVNDALSLRGEARAIHNFDNNWWEGMALAGIEVVLGGHLQPVQPVPPIEPVEVVQVEPEPEVVVPVAPTPTVTIIQDQEEVVEVDTDGDGVIDPNDDCPNTPSNLVVDNRGCPIEQEVVKEINPIELRIQFDNDKSNIKEQYVPEVAKVAQFMREYPYTNTQVNGYASKTGPSARYNQRLSEARAAAVQSMLVNQFGVDPARLTAVGHGYNDPIATNDTPEGRALNRRVEAIVTGQVVEMEYKTKE